MIIIDRTKTVTRWGGPLSDTDLYLELFTNCWIVSDTLDYTRAMECLLVMIYSPYTTYFLKYRAYEEKCLNHELNGIKMVRRL